MKRLRLYLIALSALVSINVFGGDLRALGQWPAGVHGVIEDLDVDGNTAYANVGVGVKVLDVSNPAAIRPVNTIGRANSKVAIAGRYLFEYSFEGVFLYDVQDRANPSLLWSLHQNVIDMAIAWPRVYFSTGEVEAYDFTNPSSPVKGGTVSRLLFSMQSDGAWLAGIDSFRKVWFINISSPMEPREMGSSASTNSVSSFTLAGNRAFLLNSATPTLPWILDVLDLAKLPDTTPLGQWDSQVSRFGFLDRILVQGGTAVVGVANRGHEILDISNIADIKAIARINDLGGGPKAWRGNQLFIGGTELAVYDMSVPSNPVKMGSFLTGAHGSRVRLLGDYAYLMRSDDGRILNIKNPARPADVAKLPGNLFSMIVDGTTAFATDRESNTSYYVKSFDVTNPAQPRERASLPMSEYVTALALAGDRLVLGAMNSILFVDVSNPDALRVARTIAITGTPHSAVKRGNHVYVLSRSSTNYLTILNLENPAESVLEKTIPLTGFADGMALVNSTLYVSATDQIRIFDLTDPFAPVEKPSFPIFISAEITSVGNRLYFFNSTKLTVLDVTSPFAPAVVDELPGFPLNMHEIVIRDNVAYVGAAYFGLVTVQLQGPKPAQPTVEIFSEGEIHRVRWQKGYEQFRLINAPTLDGTWSNSPLGYSPTGLFEEVTFPNASPTKFYQLKSSVAP